MVLQTHYLQLSCSCCIFAEVLPTASGCQVDQAFWAVSAAPQLLSMPLGQAAVLQTFQLHQAHTPISASLYMSLAADSPVCHAPAVRLEHVAHAWVSNVCIARQMLNCPKTMDAAAHDDESGLPQLKRGQPAAYVKQARHSVATPVRPKPGRSSGRRGESSSQIFCLWLPSSCWLKLGCRMDQMPLTVSSASWSSAFGATAGCKLHK